MAQPEPSMTFLYTFKFEDGNEESFGVQLDRKTLDLLPEPQDHYPAWTALEHHQCPNCPLDPATHPRCPIAANMVELSGFFSDSISYDETEVEIITEDRHYLKRTSIQQAVSSLMGIYMVTSGCPVMDKLRPMVRFHLPFATLEETTYRVISMYLTAQFFLYRKGQTPDWDMRNLVDIYEDIQIVNQSFFKRLGDITTQDTSTNALVILDTFANYISFSVDESLLDDIETFFSAYLPPQDKS
jgi:hypothetical protein